MKPNLLKQFYEQRMKPNTGVEYSRLSPEDKQEIEKLTSFAFYKLHIAIGELKDEVAKLFKRKKY